MSLTARVSLAGPGPPSTLFIPLVGPNAHPLLVPLLTSLVACTFGVIHSYSCIPHEGWVSQHLHESLCAPQGTAIGSSQALCVQQSV